MDNQFEKEKALYVHNLTVAFGDETILKSLDFEVDFGESLAIIGPNGSGKTVLFRTLINSLPYKGEIHWAPGITIGYVPQKLDIERNLPLSLEDFLLSRSAGYIKFPKEKINENLELVRLPLSALKRPIGQLSGGQFQRALIAFALLGNPKVFLFDEPTAGVDTPGEEEIYETIHRLQHERDLTILIISHDLSLVYRYADKVLCLNRKELCFGAPAEVLTPELLSELYGSPKHYKHTHHNAG